MGGGGGMDDPSKKNVYLWPILKFAICVANFYNNLKTHKNWPKHFFKNQKCLKRIRKVLNDFKR